MRIHVLSDLHLEHAPFTPEAVEADVVVLAGDVSTGTGGVEWARHWANGRPVLYVAGNHEFYGHALPELIDDLRRAASGSSIQVLEHDEVTIDGVRFIGCTLWSDFDFDGPERREASMRVCERVVNDFREITFTPHHGPLAPQDARALHLASRSWLEARLAAPHYGATVVITHHAPLIRERPSRSLLRAVAGAFASDVTALMDGRRAELWIFGHTHRAADLEAHGTRVVSNPRGYPHQPVAGFDPRRVVEVASARRPRDGA